MITIELKVPDVALFQEGRAASIVDDELRAAIESGLVVARGAVDPYTPQNTGALASAWLTDVTGAHVSIEGRMFNQMPYAMAVENGSVPHMPPVDPLILWAKRKLGLDEVEAKRAGWAIAISISRRGTKAAYMLRKAVDQSRGAIEGLWRKALVNVTTRLVQP